MPYAFVQQAANDSGSTAQANIATGNTGSALTAGNAMVYAIIYASTAAKTITSLTDTRGNTWVEVGNWFNATDGLGMRWGYAKNITAGGVTSLTAVFSANVDFPGIMLAEYSGLDTTAPFTAGEFAGQRVAAPGTGANAISTGNTPALAAQPAMLWGLGVNTSAPNTPAAGSGFTSRAAVLGNAWTGRPEDKRLTATSAVAATWTATVGTDNFGTVGIVLKEAVAAAAAGGRRALLGVGV